MADPEPPEHQRAAPAAWPTHTHWSVVLAAAHPGSPAARKALEELCRAYWYPVYAYVRYRGHARPDAEDLTQAFFLHLLTTEALAAATPERGRFRAFLRMSADHFIVSAWRRENTLTRGGGITFLTWEELRAEDRYARETACHLTPERLFERSWAYTLLQRSLHLLKGELAADGRASLFDALKERLLGEVGAEPYASLAPQLGTTVSALKKTVERLRGRYGEIVRREVAQTVASPDEIDDELRHLLVMVSG
jgi:RNA polymerase sigma factor (sigma-70 family)